MKIMTEPHPSEVTCLCWTQVWKWSWIIKIESGAGSKDTAQHCSLHIMCFSQTSFQVRELLNLVVNGKLRFSINRRVFVGSCSVRAVAGSQGLKLPPLEGHCYLRKQHGWILPKVPRKCKTHLGALTALHLTSAELLHLSTPCFEKPNNCNDFFLLFLIHSSQYSPSFCFLFADGEVMDLS